jgi:hypothetical protein
MAVTPSRTNQSRRRRSLLLEKCADMQLIDQSFMPGPSLPPFDAPAIGARVDDDARPMNILRLIARSRIRHAPPILQRKSIAAVRLRGIAD